MSGLRPDTASEDRSLNARIDPAALDALLAPYDRSDAPGFAVGVALGGVPGYRRGVGMASIELPVVLSPTIRMRIGSTSKQFTALAIMLLAANPLGRFIDANPTVKMLALAFILLIGAVLVLDGLEVHVPRPYIYFAMAFSVLVEWLNLLMRRKAIEHRVPGAGEF